MTKYTVGFMFTPLLDIVALIRKNKPAWQFGKLNGIGGHIEESEFPLVCQRREFHEEAEYPYDEIWSPYLLLQSPEFEVHCFATTGMIHKLHYKTDEKIELIHVNSIGNRSDTIENIPWMVYLAVDFLQDRRPGFTVANYTVLPGDGK